VKPTFSGEEVDRVAHRLGMERQQFIETFLERSEAGSDKPWQTRAAPCPVMKDNLCSIYEDRPADCSGYPYLYEPDFVFRTTVNDSVLTCSTSFPQNQVAGPHPSAENQTLAAIEFRGTRRECGHRVQHGDGR
jgi:uncharacterized protein